MYDSDDVDQVAFPQGKEGVRISTKTGGGSGGDTTTTAESTKDDVLKGASFGNSADDHAWVDEICLTDDENEPEAKELKDVVPPTPTTCTSEETSQSDLSAITDPSYIILPGSDVHIVQCTIKLAPNERLQKV